MRALGEADEASVLARQAGDDAAALAEVAAPQHHGQNAQVGPAALAPGATWGRR
jgi:hypothetical protein